MITKPVIEYIVKFLLGPGNESYGDLIAYGPHQPQTARIRITASDFWNDDVYMSQSSLPRLPLAAVEGVPLLFGDAHVERENGGLTVGADIIAGTFFLISRYEECVRRDVRDAHGRFPGRESLPFRAGFLCRPIVDEYGRLLRGWLRELGIPAKEPPYGITGVYLTHDIDQPWHRMLFFPFTVLSCCKRLLLGKPRPFDVVKSALSLRHDEAYKALDWLAYEDGRLIACAEKADVQAIYFVLLSDAGKYDNNYWMRRRRMRNLLDKVGSDAALGLHVSYAAGKRKERVAVEAGRFLKACAAPPKLCRYHFLACREPEDLTALTEAGVEEDFTHAYADVAGFRLGTCRAVHWINPVEMTVTPLVLHPMTAMECTLDAERYMQLAYEDAYAYCKALLEQIRRNAGEVTLLWHNTSVKESAPGYQRKLYHQLLSDLEKDVCCSQAGAAGGEPCKPACERSDEDALLGGTHDSEQG